MKEIVVTGKQATLRSGTVKLTTDQAASREHGLEKVEGKKDLYTIIDAVSFKRGEVFGYDGEISKTLFDTVGEVVDVKAKKAETDKAKKKAKESADALAEAQIRITELETEVESEKKRADDAEMKVTKLEEAAKSVKKDGK